MRIRAEPITLELKTPFKIAHGTSHTRENVLVYVSRGVGVAALTPYYPTTVQDVVDYVESAELVELMGEADPFLLEDLLDTLPPGPKPARAAVDIALHDQWAQRFGEPLYRLWGLNPARAPLSSLTIGMADEQEYRARLRAAAHLPVLKIKLGTGSLLMDEALVRVAREETEAVLCVDANAAWTAEEALAIIPKLAGYRLLFIEQPVGNDDLEGWRAVKAGLPPEMPPLIADESVHSAFDVLKLYHAADGINIKLAKCGGLREARKLIALARSLHMKVMLGCMVETSVGVTAAAHLAPLVDYLDLDGNLDLLNDPYAGIGWEAGQLVFPARSGLGVRRV